MRRALRDIAGFQVASSLAGLAGWLEAETEQENPSGIVVIVVFGNQGDAEIAIVNPFPLVQFRVLDAAGLPVDVPAKPPPVFGHYADGEDWSLTGPVPVAGAWRNDRAVEPNELAGRVIRFPAGDECRVAFLIGQVTLPSTPSAVDLPPGTYRVTIIATLIDPDDASRSRILESDTIEVRYARRTELPLNRSTSARRA
jgi:hypothetical protein